MDLGEWWDVEGEATVTWEAWEGCRRWPTLYLLTSVAWWSAKVRNDSVCFTGSSLALCEYSKKSFFLIYFIIDLNFLSHVVCSLNPRLLIQTLLITVYPTSPDCPFFFFFFFLSPFITPTPFGLLPLRETDEEKGEEKGVVCVCVWPPSYSPFGAHVYSTSGIHWLH